MSDAKPTPTWCPDGFVEFLETSLTAHQRHAVLIREGVAKGVFPEHMLRDQETLASRCEDLIEAIRNDDPETFRRVSSHGIALSTALSDQAGALRRDRKATGDESTGE